MYKIDKEKNKIFNYRHKTTNSIVSNSISCVNEDSEGNIWIGTSDAGVSVLNTKKQYFENYTNTPKTNSLSHNFIKFIFEDSKKNMWIGTYGGGLNLFNKKQKDFSPLEGQEYKTSRPYHHKSRCVFQSFFEVLLDRFHKILWPRRFYLL